MEQVDSLRTEQKFKKTEIGEIPVDWEVELISKTCTINPSKKEIDALGDIKEASFLPMEFVGEDGEGVMQMEVRNISEVIKGYTYFRENDVLFAKITPCMENGKIAIASNLKNGIGFGSTEFHVLRPNMNLLLPEILFYWMSRKLFRELAKNFFTGTAGQQRVQRGFFDITRIPLASLPEQKKIAEILLTVDEAIEKRKEIIEKTKELKKGLMQQLLTHGIGHKKFKKTEVSEIPVEWEIVCLSEIGEIITGSTPSTKNRDYYNGQYMFVTPFDMGDFKYVTKTAITLSEEGINVSRRLPRDTVMVTCIASIGKIGIASEECCTNQQINSIICNEKAEPHFVYYMIQTKINVLKALAGQTAVPIVKKSLFSDVLIPFPIFSEQKKIAEILSSIDEEIEKDKNSLNKLQNLKKGLMQVLLTGKVRVKM